MDHSQNLMGSKLDQEFSYFSMKSNQQYLSNPANKPIVLNFILTWWR